jgi:hypothetical protein
VSELDDGKKGKKKKPKPKEKKPRKCPMCACLHLPRPNCPSCGYEYPRRALPEHESGELKEVGGKVKATMQEKQEFHAMLVDAWEEHNRKGGKQWSRGWISHKYRAKFGCWARGIDEGLCIPQSTEFRSWMRASWIRFIKSKEKGSKS